MANGIQISQEGADFILDIIDSCIDIVEALAWYEEENKYDN